MTDTTTAAVAAPAPRKRAIRGTTGASTKPSARKRKPPVNTDAAAAPVAAPPTSKIGQVLALLQREQGALLAELVAATGWLPHTTRAALTGLRRKGHAIEKLSHDGVTRYRLPASA